MRVLAAGHQFEQKPGIGVAGYWGRTVEMPLSLGLAFPAADDLWVKLIAERMHVGKPKDPRPISISS